MKNEIENNQKKFKHQLKNYYLKKKCQKNKKIIISGKIIYQNY